MALTEKERLEREAIASHLSEAARPDTFPVHFRLLAPSQLTVKIGHQFKKKPFIGDEHFTLQTAYVGKRGGIIVVFKPEAPSEINTVEIPLMECETLLDGWTIWRQHALREFEGDGVHVPLRPVAPTPSEELVSDPNYGSW